MSQISLIPRSYPNKGLQGFIEGGGVPWDSPPPPLTKVPPPPPPEILQQQLNNIEETLQLFFKYIYKTSLKLT